jgi:CRP-like cAMP-binding protein
VGHKAEIGVIVTLSSSEQSRFLNFFHHRSTGYQHVYVQKHPNSVHASSADFFGCLESRCEIVFSQGDVAEAVFYVQQGKVKLTVVSEQGKEAVVAILGPGHFFGEGCLNGHPLRIATTTAVDDDCVITRLEKATMIATIHNEPEFSELFMSYLLIRNSRIEEDLIDQLFNSSEKRLARLLLLLANFGKEGRPEPIVGKFSQETLAEMIGTTRSRVCRSQARQDARRAPPAAGAGC